LFIGGGQGWSGATACVSGTTCVAQNEWYSQCLSGVSSHVTSNPDQPLTHTCFIQSAASSSAPTNTATGGQAASTPGLNALAKSHGKLYFGSATGGSELNDATYVKMLSDNTMFGQLTPGNAMKWDATEPSQGHFSWTGADQIVNLAKANGQLLRGEFLGCI
jgi:endo-1,4-beta-xylanase